VPIRNSTLQDAGAFCAPAEEFSSGHLRNCCKGNDIYWADGELRAGIDYGRRPDIHCSTQETFGGFNSDDAKIEWQTAFATIQRWRVSYHPENSERIKDVAGRHPA
jgi:hypothetical protein